MGKNIRHYELPVPSTESVTDASLHVHGKTAVIRFDYYLNGKPCRRSLRFSGVSSTRSRSERCSGKSQDIRAFDVLLEITESKWVEEQRNAIDPLYRSGFAARHYMIYFDSVGAIEVLAEAFELTPEETGSWVESREVPTAI